MVLPFLHRSRLLRLLKFDRISDMTCKSPLDKPVTSKARDDGYLQLTQDEVRKTVKKNKKKKDVWNIYKAWFPLSVEKSSRFLCFCFNRSVIGWLNWRHYFNQ